MANLYRWHSALLANYAPGDLIAVADSADEAREKLRAGFDTWVKEHREWVLYVEPEDEEQDGKTALRRKLETDLLAQPEIHQALYIRGSE